MIVETTNSNTESMKKLQARVKALKKLIIRKFNVTLVEDAMSAALSQCDTRTQVSTAQ